MKNEDPSAVGANEKGAGEAQATPAILNTALRAVAWMGDDKACRRLLAKGAPADGRGAEGETALMIAAKRGMVDAVRELLVHADPLLTDRAERGALFFAAESGASECCELLVGALMAVATPTELLSQLRFARSAAAETRSQGAWEALAPYEAMASQKVELEKAAGPGGAPRAAPRL